MAHFARLDEFNTVLEVIVVNNDVILDLSFPESEPIGIEFCQFLYGSNTIWKQTSYNNNFRGQYAYVGGSYDPQLDIFVGPQPAPSWTYDGALGLWVPPVPKPDEPEGYIAIWNEASLSWDLVLAE